MQIFSARIGRPAPQQAAAHDPLEHPVIAAGIHHSDQRVAQALGWRNSTVKLSSVSSTMRDRTTPNSGKTRNTTSPARQGEAARIRPPSMEMSTRGAVSALLPVKNLHRFRCREALLAVLSRQFDAGAHRQDQHDQVVDAPEENDPGHSSRLALRREIGGAGV